MRFLLACLFIGLYSVTAQPIAPFNNRPLNQPFNQPIAAANNPFAANNININPFAVNNPLAGLQQPFNNPAAVAAAGPSVGFPLNQPVLSGLNQPLLPGLNQLNQPLLNQINQPMMGLNAFNNPLAQQQAFPQPQFFVQQAFPQQSLPQQAVSQQNLLQQQPIAGAAPQMGGLNLAGLTDQQIQQLAMQAAQPTLNQWLSNDHQAIFQRAGALNNLPSINNNQQPITAAGGPLQGVQAIQAMPNTLAALQQQMQQPLTQNLLQLNPNLAQWMQQQQLAMQQAVRGPSPAPVAAAASAPPAQQFPIPGNSPVGQFQVDQGPLTGANPQAIMMPSMQSRPASQSSNINQPLAPTPSFNQPILQGVQIPSGLQFNAPDVQDFTLTPSGPVPQPAQPIDPQRSASSSQPILNQGPGQTSMNPSGPQPLAPQLSPMMNQINPAAPQAPNMNNPMNAPRPRP